MNYAEYDALPGVRASRLRLMASSPLHYREYVDSDSAARVKLRMIHSLVLEPENAAYAVYPGPVRRGKEYEAFARQNPGLPILNANEAASVHSIASGIARHSLAASILRAPGESEVSVQWTDEPTGLACKARLDRRVDTDPPTIVDLKTYGSSDPRIIARRVAQLGAHIQAAHYCAGLASTLGIDATEIRYLLICVEDRAPYDVAVVELEYDDALVVGRTERDRLLAILADCLAKDEWPGRCPDVAALQLPDWANPDDDDIIGDKE